MTDLQDDCVTFGRALLETADLDPLYVMLAGAELGHVQLGRFLLGYGMFYHAGVACQLASKMPNSAGFSSGYWEAAWELLKTAPRGTERRHFRGELAEKTITALWKMGEPEVALSKIYPLTNYATNPLFPVLRFQDVFDGAQSLTGFGPWIAFKMADIGERTQYRAIDFAGCHLDIYKDPVKGAALWRYGDQEAPIKAEEVGEVCEEVRLAVGERRMAPPLYDRPINIQEVETILCKFKSHINGHYAVGKDTKEIIHGLKGWGPLADRLADCPLL